MRKPVLNKLKYQFQLYLNSNLAIENLHLRMGRLALWFGHLKPTSHAQEQAAYLATGTCSELNLENKMGEILFIGYAVIVIVVSLGVVAHHDYTEWKKTWKT